MRIIGRISGERSLEKLGSDAPAPARNRWVAWRPAGLLCLAAALVAALLLVAPNYALSAAGLSKGSTVEDGYWLGLADGPHDPDDFSRVLKTSAQIAEDMAVLHGTQDATAAGKDKAAVTAEYTNYMNGKSADGSADQEVRLYTRWSGSIEDGSGSAVSEAANEYVEFRIIQVGPHDNGVGGVDDDGSAVTFAATHSLPTAQAMSSFYHAWEGWEKSEMHISVLGDGGYVQAGLSDLKNAVKPVAKKTFYRESRMDDLSVSETKDKFWLLSNSEVFGADPETNGLIGSGFYDEGSQYDWFKANDVNAKKGWVTANSAIEDMWKTRSGSHPVGCGDETWWLRSSDVLDLDYYGGVSSDGHPYRYYYSANCARGVVVAFAM